MTIKTGHSVSVAFALTFAAGFATVLGGCVIFSKRLVHLANPASLAIALSISAGVMLFISFVEIFGESVQLFTEGIQKKYPTLSHKTAHGHGWLLATTCFAGGITVIYIIDAIVHKISPDVHAGEESLENLAVEEQLNIMEGHVMPAETKAAEYKMAEVTKETTAEKNNKKIAEQHKLALQRMGVLSALAIGIHNMPEGIATYVGAAHDSSVGFSLAIGIGLHNIPEGIAVTAPIYFATGSRARGIFWCFISALAEPLGGVIAWLAIGDGMDPISEGILFGFVCGIMVCIVMKELLPTAYRFAKERDNLVTFGAYGGMFIMALSFILFGYAGV